MIRVAMLALAVCMAEPVQAQNTSAGAGLHVTVLPEPRADGALGEIVHHNRVTGGRFGEEFFEFETVRGMVILRLVTTQNSNCVPACPDTLDVWALPPGLVAIPPSVTTAEGGVSIIALREWEGM